MVGDRRRQTVLIRPLQRVDSRRAHVASTCGNIFSAPWPDPGPHDPMRPSRIELSDSDGYDFLKPKLGELDIGCVLTDELPKLQQFCRSLAAGYGGPEKCALADGAGVTREQMESFYYAAARYFEQAPWKHVTGEIPIEIRCRGLDVGILYAIVLGDGERRWGWPCTAAGTTSAALSAVRAILTGCPGFPSFSTKSRSWRRSISIWSSANGWPIRTPEAYPAVMRYEPGRQPHSPGGEELAYVECCLRVVPDFVAGGQRAKTFAIVACGKQIKLRLAWKVCDG